MMPSLQSRVCCSGPRQARRSQHNRGVIEPGGQERRRDRTVRYPWGRLISWYLSSGEYDGVLIYEAPDDATAGVLVLGAARHGHLRATKSRVPSLLY
jgi:hypothetical protein